MTPMERYGTDGEEERESAIEAAALALQRGGLAVIPTDTVYGIAADAFDPAAVRALLAAKGRGREMPPPVLVSASTTLDALAVRVPGYARTLVEEFWPGPLTLVCHQQTSLQWDLGETRGTVAVRMPDHALAREVLERTGPLAVSSANRTGMPAATDADRAEDMLGEVVDVIVDVTGTQGRVLRLGALSLEQLNAVLEPLGATLVLEDGAPEEDPDPGTDAAFDPHGEPAKDTDEGGA